MKKGDSRSDIVILLSRPSDCIMITGAVKNNKNGGPISYALVTLTNEKGEAKSIPSDELGAFSVCLPCGHAYKAYATKESAMSTVENVSTKEFK